VFYNCFKSYSPAMSMAEDERKEEALGLSMVIPELLYRRIYALTQTENALEAITRLCNMGYPELASLIILYMGTGGDTNAAFHPYPISDHLVACETRQTSVASYKVLFRLEREETDDVSCISIDIHGDKFFVRPCTVKEVEAEIQPLRTPEKKGGFVVVEEVISPRTTAV